MSATWSSGVPNSLSILTLWCCLPRQQPLSSSKPVSDTLQTKLFCVPPPPLPLLLHLLPYHCHGNWLPHSPLAWIPQKHKHLLFLLLLPTWVSFHLSVIMLDCLEKFCSEQTGRSCSGHMLIYTDSSLPQPGKSLVEINLLKAMKIINIFSFSFFLWVLNKH